MIRFILPLAIFSFLLSCNNPNNNPNLDEKGKDELKSLEITRTLDKSELDFHDIIYVPIYSDIYVDRQTPKILLSATLSVRNTSYQDSLFISKIDYFNTDGDLVRSYIDNTISLPPMGTVNYVIEREDDTGGPGANFIVELNGKSSKIKPIVQAVMIGQTGNRTFSFLTAGYSVN